MSSFIHLHTHSDFSLLKSTLSIKSLVQATQKLGMPAIALTDSANMYGAMDFFVEAEKNSIKPIIGCEFQIQLTTGHLAQLIILSENNKGYSNLVKLSSASFTNNTTLPYLKLSDLKQYNQHLIVLTGGFFGAIDYYLQQEDFSQAKEILTYYTQCFGKENIYFEIQKHIGFSKEEKHLPIALDFAHEHQLPLVATNNVHYSDIEDVKLHEILMSIDEQERLMAPTISQKELGKDKQNKRKMPGQGYHLKTYEEMQNDFKDFPEALENTLVIANRCQVDIKDKQLHMPQISGSTFAENKSDILLLKEKSLKRLKTKIPEITPEYLNRLNYEIAVIEKMQFSSYFLIVADFVNAAKEKGILVGPGRGSAAGSLVSYSLGITDVNPIEYNLLFERFLNPERISMPDIDIDFQDNRRDEVIKYTQNKYGKDQVCQIITYGKLKMKAVLKDIARVFNLSFEQSNNLSSLVGKEKNLILEYENNIEFRSLINSSEQYKNIYHYASKLEGLTRQTGIHAAGVVLADKAIANYCPISYDPENSCPYISQYEAELLENYCGLIKMDFLGLSTLTIIDNTIKLIKEHRQEEIDLAQIPLDNSKTYTLFAENRTLGIFQFESQGMSKYLQELKPDCIDHLVAMNAMYRPGPLSWIPVYIGKKNNSLIQFNQFEDEKKYKTLETICGKNEILKNILAPTYLIPIYQEQIMQIGRDYAGFTLGESDIMRRAMGKKKADELIKIKKKFIDGANEKGYSKEDSDFLFEEIIMPFSGYGFNKSHSVCYAIIAYQTAYLKANYTVEFLISFLNLKIERSGEKLDGYIDEAKFLGIEILPPDINQSDVFFKQIPGTNKILYALSGIKAFGKNISHKIIDERKANGLYRDFFDLYYRNYKTLNKQNVTFLIKSFAFDGIESLNPKQMINNRQQLVDIINAYQSIKDEGQVSMFDALENGSNKNDRQEKLEIFRKNIILEDVSFLELQEYEKEALGFNIKFITEKHLAPLFNEKSTISSDQLFSTQEKKNYQIAGIIENLFINYTKKDNQEMASVILKRHDGKIKLVCFSKQWAILKNKTNKKEQPFLKDRKTGEGQTVVCSFNIFKREENITYQITNIEYLESEEFLHQPYQYQKKQVKINQKKAATNLPQTTQISSEKETLKEELKSTNLTSKHTEKKAKKEEEEKLHLAILLNSFLSIDEAEVLSEKLLPYAIKSSTEISEKNSNSNHYPVNFYLRQTKQNTYSKTSEVRIQKIDFPSQIQLDLPNKEALNELLELSFVNQIRFLSILKIL